MESVSFIDADTLKLTIIPGLIVVVVLFLWFRRSEPRAPSVRERQVKRSRFSAVEDFDDEYDLAIAKDNAASSSGGPVDYDDDYVPDPLDDWQEREPSAAPAKNVAKQAQSKGLKPRETEADESASLRAEAETHEMNEAAAAGESKLLPPHDSLILVLNVVGNNHTLRGSQILKALTATGMSFGKMNIFHYVGPNRPAHRPLFSVANMMEPGSFNLSTMEELATPGLTLFANIGRPEEAMATFSIMLETARQLARTLDGLVCDEKRSTLTKQGIEHIHSRIADFQRRSRLAQAANA